MNIQIDTVGDSYVEKNIKEFKKWFEAHKSKIIKMNMKMLNNKIHWIDDNKNRYKLHNIRGNYVLRRCEKNYYQDKHDLVNKLIALDTKINELNQILLKWSKLDVPSGAEPGNEGIVEELPKPVLSIKFPKV